MTILNLRGLFASSSVKTRSAGQVQVTHFSVKPNGISKMKRRRGDALRGSARKQARRATIGPRFVFVTVAGAFGKLPQEDEVNLKNILAGIGPDVKVLEPARSIHSKDATGNFGMLRGGSGCTIKVLESVRHHLFAAASAYPLAKIFCMTQSFGGRATVHTALQRYEDKKKNAKESYPPWPNPPGPALPENFSGMILCGYPIAHAKQNRALPLLLLSELKKKVKKIGFIAGTNDHGCENGGLLERTVRTMEKTMGSKCCKIHFVNGGGHNPFDSRPQSMRLGKITGAIEFIKDFIGYHEPS